MDGANGSAYAVAEPVNPWLLFGAATDQQVQQAAFQFFTQEQVSLQKLCRKIVRGTFRRCAYAQHYEEALDEALRVIPQIMRTYDTRSAASLKTHVLTSVRWYVWKLFWRAPKGKSAMPWLQSIQTIFDQHVSVECEDDEYLRRKAEQQSIEQQTQDDKVFDNLQQVQYLLTKVGEPHASILKMVYVCGLTIAEVGVVLGYKGQCGKVQEAIKTALHEVKKIAAAEEWRHDARHNQDANRRRT